MQKRQSRIIALRAAGGRVDPAVRVEGLGVGPPRCLVRVDGPGDEHDQRALRNDCVEDACGTRGYADGGGDGRVDA